MNIYLRFRLCIDNNMKVAPQLLEGPHARRKNFISSRKKPINDWKSTHNYNEQ